jgi:hypothetical protein
MVARPVILAEPAPKRTLVADAQLTHNVPGTLLAMAGDWDGDGRDGVGVVDTVAWRVTLWNDLASATPDETLSLPAPTGSAPQALGGRWHY